MCVCVLQRCDVGPAAREAGFLAVPQEAVQRNTETPPTHRPWGVSSPHTHTHTHTWTHPKGFTDEEEWISDRVKLYRCPTTHITPPQVWRSAYSRVPTVTFRSTITPDSCFIPSLSYSHPLYILNAAREYITGWQVVKSKHAFKNTNKQKKKTPPCPRLDHVIPVLTWSSLIDH